ncbi:MAG: PKD domain-containing protein, partial [bacterium]|nr:PKD domain-containing protein [bacterium]
FDNDGTVDSTDQNPMWTYNSLGGKTVTLTASNQLGPDTITKVDVVTVFPPVTAQFSGTPLSGPAPHSVTFTDLSSGSPTSWQWDFDSDGTVDSTVQNPTHVFATPGSYSVKLVATGPGGAGEELKFDYVAVSGTVVADFTATSASGDDVQFTDQSTGANSWQWDFDDDGTVDSTQQNPTYTFPAAGTYSVRLTATGPGGSDEEFKFGYITVTTIEPTKDTSIYSEATGRSNGQHPSLVGGNAALTNGTQQGVRRALVEFDIASAVPSGATVLTAALQLTNTFSPSNPIGNVVFSLAPVSTEWGEAPLPGSNSNIGGGTTAAAGDATWASAIVGSTNWSSAGGDFGGQVASRVVGGVGSYTWSSAGMVTNVGNWRLTPANNHGWIIRGTEVSGTRTAKVFGSAQDPTVGDRPKLTIAYRTFP